jgi:hypothetical protein
MMELHKVYQEEPSERLEQIFRLEKINDHHFEPPTLFELNEFTELF